VTGTGAPSSEDLVIEIRDLVSAFGDRVIHDHLNLDVRRGEVLAVVGGSGTGKSVLLNTIIGLKRPEGGEITVFGQNIHQSTRRAWSDIERRWGVLFQQGALFSNLSVRENVAAPLYEHTKLSRSEARELADLRIGLVGLPPEAGSLKPSELSGGMRKRAGLARALVMDPEMITHDLDSLYTITDRVAVLADKKVVAVAPVEELETSDHPWIKEYFLGPRGRAAAKAHKSRTMA